MVEHKVTKKEIKKNKKEWSEIITDKIKEIKNKFSEEGEEVLGCPHCHWFGKKNQTIPLQSNGMSTLGFNLHCPSCDSHLGWYSFCKIRHE